MSSANESFLSCISKVTIGCTALDKTGSDIDPLPIHLAKCVPLSEKGCNLFLRKKPRKVKHQSKMGIEESFFKKLVID